MTLAVIICLLATPFSAQAATANSTTVNGWTNSVGEDLTVRSDDTANIRTTYENNAGEISSGTHPYLDTITIVQDGSELTILSRTDVTIKVRDSSSTTVIARPAK